MDDDSIKAYGREELALLYNPNLSACRAWQRLKMWIGYNKPLSLSLFKTGYTPNQRTFTPRQVALIFEHLGRP